MENGTIINQYKIISPIGKGGMGEVFLAQDTKLDRKVAIKFLNEELSKDADKLNRFIQEAKAVSALNHPNILTVHEIGESESSNYIVTEFIEGRTLREQITPRKTKSLNEILKIGVQIAEALSAAHQAGIIHRDIKPENIMIRQDGYAKVLDFGLAKLIEQKPKDEILSEDTTKGLVKTNPGMVMGTVSYMSPEQARGKDTDARTDIWSLGVVLYEMLSGRVPFTGETINHTIVSILENEPLHLENVPDELQRIIRKALTKDADMRYQTAKDLLIDLKNLRRSLDIQGELERSFVPNRETVTDHIQENQTAIYSAKSIEDTKAESGAVATQNVTTSSSLEYAVTKAKTHKLATAIIGLIMLSLISAIAYFGFFAKRGGQIESIAVMPFVNESKNEDVEYLSDGMTETLINSLSQIPNLSVKARSTVFYYKGKEISPQKIGEELKVQAILNGRVVQRGNDLVLYLSLVDVKTGDQIWGETYNRKQSDLVILQTEIAKDVSTKLKSKLSSAEAAGVEKNYTANSEAYQLYLQGRYHWNQRNTKAFEKAVEFFKQAIEKDPKYALAYSGLADTYALFPAYGEFRPKDYLPKAKEAAQKALELDPNLAEAHASLGQILLYSDYDFAGSERSHKRAIELNPKYATAHQWYGELLFVSGRQDEAFKELTKALELDPISRIINSEMRKFLLLAKRFDEALLQSKKMNEMFPNEAAFQGSNAEINEAQGKYAEAFQEYILAAKTDGTKPEEIQEMKAVYEKGGWDGFKKAEMEQILKSLKDEGAKDKNEYVNAIRFAFAYAGLGDKDKTVEYLNKAYEERALDMIYLNVDFVWDFVRDDPRFKELVRKVGFPE